MWDRKFENKVWEERKHAYGRRTDAFWHESSPRLRGVAGRGAGRLLPAQPASTAIQPAGTTACRAPTASRQPPPGLAEARWVLADFGGLFGAFRGPIFNPKEVRTQVRHTMNQMKEIWDKIGLRFDRSEFSKLGCRKRSKSEKR